MSKLLLENIVILTLWLEPKDYPELIACCDVGISLHTSTSNLDLPMKILDCYGCHVPVIAKNFDCLHELVQDGINSKVFDTPIELANTLYNLLKPLADDGNSSKGLGPHSYGELNKYSNALQNRKRWDENWIQNALPIIIGEDDDDGDDQHGDDENEKED